MTNSGDKRSTEGVADLSWDIVLHEKDLQPQKALVLEMSEIIKKREVASANFIHLGTLEKY